MAPLVCVYEVVNPGTVETLGQPESRLGLGVVDLDDSGGDGRLVIDHRTLA